MSDYAAMLKSAHDQLNNAHTQYAQTNSGLEKEFDALKLQASIFQYEMCIELVTFETNKPNGFAQYVALKGIIHKLYEYEILLNGELVRRVKKLAMDRNMSTFSIDLKSEKKKWTKEFKSIKRWVTTRNFATGHYDKDIQLQIDSLIAIDPQSVLDACTAFLHFNLAFLHQLKEVGLSWHFQYKNTSPSAK